MDLNNCGLFKVVLNYVVRGLKFPHFELPQALQGPCSNKEVLLPQSIRFEEHMVVNI